MTRITRWRLLASAAAAIASSVPVQAQSDRAGAPPPPAQRPNIVFILSDDHAWQSISAYGSRIAATPAIDRIGREGAVMTRMLSPNSLCAPARAALLTGKLSHRNGIAINYDVFDGAQPTLQSRLRGAGYRTALFGKWHLKSDPTGFDAWEILSDLQGQGRYYNPNFQSPRGVAERKGYATRITTDLTLNWLRSRPRDGKPFLLMMWHKGPHRPFDPDVTAPRPQRAAPPPPASITDSYSNRPDAAYQRMEIGRDLNPRDLKLTYPYMANAAQKAAWNRRYAAANAEYRRARPLGVAATMWNYRRYITGYLDAAAEVDDSVGALLNELDRQGIAQNTIVIYSSDQGFFLGEHGWFDKRWFYEESLRAPFLIRWPGRIRAGSRINAVASQIDVLPTLLDAAGVIGDTGLQGATLLPALRGGGAPVRDGVYLRYSECPGEHVVPCFYGMVNDRYKLVYLHQPGIRRWELYDRVADPAETRNLYDDPRYATVRTQLMAQLDAMRREAGDDADPETGSGILKRFLVTLVERAVKLFRLGESAQ